MNVKFKSPKMMFVGAIVMLVLVVAVGAFVASPQQADGQAVLKGRALLDTLQPRQFPNEMPPRDDLVVAEAAGVSLDDQFAIDQWYKEFYTKKEKSGPNPIAFKQRMKELAQAEAMGLSPKAAGLGEIGDAKMLMVAFEFAGEDTIAACQPDGTPAGDVTVGGPLHNEIPNPAGTGDNGTLWTDDFNIDWYDNLFFGDGVGVVRTDLNDGAGVDLTGVSATKWYAEQSEGQYNLMGEFYPGWVQVDHSEAWYGWEADDVSPDGLVPCNGTPSGFGFEFVIDVVDKINEMDPNYDWSQWDLDGDQIVDHFMLVHAGVGNEAGGGAQGNMAIWSHSWDVWTVTYDDEGNPIDFEYGYQVAGMDTPEDESDDIWVANYTVVPEDADIGVVVHEYGHDIGLPDYYDTSGLASNSTSHWIVMSGGSWNGPLGGSHPAPFNPWARYFFGWEDPLKINYDDPPQTIMLGQSEPTPSDTVDTLWINLPDQRVAVPNKAGDGKGLHAELGDMVVETLTRSFDLSGTTAPKFSFDTWFSIEPDWDYTYILASTDGENWDILLNEEGVYATDDPNGSFAYWGPGGLTGDYEGKLTYDLSAYAGGMVYLQFAYATDQAVQYPGIWVDNFSLDDGDTNLYFNDLEDSSDWENDGWEEVPYDQSFTHYYLAEWRNDDGSIAQEGLKYIYYSVRHDGEGWMRDVFSANVPGMVLYYRNNFYENNQILVGRYNDPPATGPKGELLVVDSHYEPVVWSGGLWDPTADNPDDPGVGNYNMRFSNRRGAMDAAFTLEDTPPWMIHDYADSANPVMDFGSRPAVPAFHDSMRSVPGWLYPGGSFVYPVDSNASVVIPGASEYTTRIRGLDATGTMPGPDIKGFWGYTVSGRVLGSGNPGDTASQFGLHLQVVDRAEDGSYGEIAVWQSKWEVDGSITQIPNADPLMYGDTVDVEVMATNIATGNGDGLVMVPIDNATTYVEGSAWGGAKPLTAAQVAELSARYDLGNEFSVQQADADAVVAVAWEGPIGTGEEVNFGFTVEVTQYDGFVHHSAVFAVDAHMFQILHSDVLDIFDDGLRTVMLPLTADTWVNGGEPAKNYMWDGKLVTRPTGLDNALLTFDRSALPEGANVVSAELTVHVTYETGALGKQLMVMNVDPFDAEMVTYADGLNFYNPGPGMDVAMGMLTLDATNQVMAWDADGSPGNPQLAIASDGPLGRVVFDSMQSSNPPPAETAPPVLVVTYSVSD